MNEEKQLPQIDKGEIPLWRKSQNGWEITKTVHSEKFYRFLMRKGKLMELTTTTTQKPRSNNSGGISGGISDIEEERLKWLSEVYGNNYKHPRTFDLIRFVSEANRNNQGLYSGIKKHLKDNKHYQGLPRIQYHREVNRCVAVKLQKLPDGSKKILPNSLIKHKEPKYWKSIWDMGNITRKFNIWGNDRYNWGDAPIIAQQRLIERCNYLANQIYNRK